MLGSKVKMTKSELWSSIVHWLVAQHSETETDNIVHLSVVTKVLVEEPGGKEREREAQKT